MSLFGGIHLTPTPDIRNIQRLDLLPIRQIQRMQRLGVKVDLQWLREVESQLDIKKEELKYSISSYFPIEVVEQFIGESGDDLEINPESADQISALLFDHLGLHVGKPIKRTKSGARLTTGKKTLEQLKREHPVVPLILGYREVSKLVSTYCRSLPKLSVIHPAGPHCPVCGMPHYETHNRIHTSILTTRAATGRLASKAPNLQNIPARSELGRLIRAAFTAQLGKKLISRDFAQIELRLLGDQANEPNMISIFKRGGDIHLDTAMRAFGIVDPTKVDKMLHRAPCKNVNFGVCIAEGQKVLTKRRGLVPIQNVSVYDMIWDGVNWVHHQGVIYKGIKRVIHYDNLTATPTHKVWLQDGRQVTLSQAMEEGSRLAVTGVGERAVTAQFIEGGEGRRDMDSGWVQACIPSLSRMQEGAGGVSGQHPIRQEPRVQVYTNQVYNQYSEITGRPLLCNPTAMYQPIKRKLRQLWSAWNRVQVPDTGRVHSVYPTLPTTPDLSWGGHWQDQQQRELRDGEFATGNQNSQPQQHHEECAGGVQGGGHDGHSGVQEAEGGLPFISVVGGEDKSAVESGGELAGGTKESAEGETLMRVYDILNAGPLHRFTCQGKLVSNCYGLGPPGLLDLMALTYATAGLDLPDWLTVDWCERFIGQWFGLYPAVQDYLDHEYDNARRYGMSWTMFGRVRLVPEMMSVHSRVQAAGLRQAGNHSIQGGAADLMKLAMAIVEQELSGMRQGGIGVDALLPIHDELLSEADEDWAEGANVVIGECMDRVLVDESTGVELCRVPIRSDGKVMDRWEK